MPAPFVLSSDLVSAYPAKSVELANFINGYKLDTGPVQNAQTGNSYTFALSDTTKTVTANNAAASAYTVPPQSAVVWEDYTTLRILNLGAGVVTLTAGAGVTLTGTVTVAQYSSATLVRTASNTWTVAGSGAAPGMDLITPTSVAGSGVTLSGGQVTISAAATVSANGCFTASYDNYLIAYDVTCTTSSWLHMRMRLSGTDNSASTYYDMYMYAGGGSAVSAQRTVQSDGMRVGYAYSVGSYSMGGTVNLFAPAIARATSLMANAPTDGTGITIRSIGGLHSTATAFDGFTITPVSGGALTGKLRIYGLRNS